MENLELYEKLIVEEYEDGINIIDFKSEYKNEIEELIIPDSWCVRAITQKSFYAPSPFERCGALRKVVLPSTLKVINYAFCSCCELETVIFPDNLEKVGNWNFRDCDKLNSIILPHTLKRIGYGNFESCPALVSESEGETDGCLYLGEYLIDCVDDHRGTLTIKDGTVLIADCACSETDFSEVIFPSSLRYIGIQAFYCCDDLQKPVLPASIEYIGEQAFYTENGDIIPNTHVTDGYFDENGKFVLCDELGFISEENLLEQAKKFDGYLLKIYYEKENSYDGSDDDRVEEYSFSRDDYTVYRDFNALKDSKALLRVDGDIKGVVFRVSEKPHSEPELYAFTFDGKVCQTMTLGYSASHSSDFTKVKKITLVKSGENGAPEKGGHINFEPNKRSTSI